ncbi:2-amino-4-hydroxy-6-hydroxymethyldihydropteridinediphosphokinase [Nitrosomonas sp. PY1]|uniref:2-amino-4-hydroxy-6- hydroxymethyldihydropteridine diphosphokinase n=1 Tax=Nitrosomonas sp. PY1 TaxID=1803906 RepID=UPI001FC813EE|nr:2-amino-4-hydroxy-6-hydroxymethyldihydropteridine diphosphokinase [Nitrosomonas sp. PY1]GKS68016.1 2-amino-4-hydroxy-6-hydroxymethyldihydropteridinediphosphokinase [Nitrosomonas sp. PY1]
MNSKKKWSEAFIALGSNLEKPIQQIQEAFEELAHIPETQLIKQSSLYQSAPIGRLNQPDFVNAVVRIKTHLTPHELFDELMAIEQIHGRVRESLNAPRTLDLDLLLYDILTFQDKQLIIPHPRMFQRAFVLVPLQEIAPDCFIPGHGSISQLVAACFDQKIQSISLEN